MMARLKGLLSSKVPCVHFSIDDCVLGLQEASEGDKKSLFDNDYYGFLKSVHEKTGAVISSYFFYENSTLERVTKPFDLSLADQRYRADFIQSADWLKLGIHALNRQTPMNSQTREEVKDFVDRTIQAIYKFAGKESHAHSWRPHYYCGNKDACNIMKNKGINLLLTAEDDRKIIACLTPSIAKKMMKGGFFYDEHSGLDLLHTSFRIEDPTISLGDMEKRVEQDLQNFRVCSFYTHEYELVKTGKNTEAIRQRTLDLLRRISKKGIIWVEN